ncbi:hypothetical protein RDI58_027428 [Solanum bulbocastanum]|uniref:Signal recognition particle receptor subunit beta n=1 Tax=Solanum bulbocastanum TaxID=147425 RepID=A0AAN8Y2C7_SOLBU
MKLKNSSIIYLLFNSILLLELYYPLLLWLLIIACSSVQYLTPLYSLVETYLFYQGTVTSILEPNEGSFILHSEEDKKGKLKPVHVVDVPGHSRLRPKLDEFLPQAAGVVFVVDFVEFLPNCRPASEY